MHIYQARKYQAFTKVHYPGIIASPNLASETNTYNFIITDANRTIGDNFAIFRQDPFRKVDCFHGDENTSGAG
jgi:hypothetical protein